jgi:hypothetical protein
MSDQAAAQDPESSGVGGISPIWALVAIIMVVALYTTIHGLHSLTGSYVYAIPFGLVAQSILLIVSLNLGRDIARKASGRTDEVQMTAGARAIRTLFLTAVYALFFGICWFFAFSTYYNIFLARGDDVQTTASQSLQLGDQVLPELRKRVEDNVANGSKTLKEGAVVAGFVKQLDDLLGAAGRSEVGATIAQAAFQAAQDAFDNRQRQRDQWRGELSALRQRQAASQSNLLNQERSLAKLKAEGAEELPSRIRDLRRAIQEEATGVLPPLPEDASSSTNPGATTPSASPEVAPAQSRPGGPASKRPPVAAPRVSPTPPDARPGQLKSDGLASKLVSESSCRIDRVIGKGDCSSAIENALKQAEARSQTLPAEITRLESALEVARAEAGALPKRISDIEQQLAANPPLSPPPPRETAPGVRPAGPNLAPLNKARQAFANSPTEETLTALSDACRPIESALRALKPAPPVLSGFDCRPEPILSAVMGQQRLVEAERAFSDRCSSVAAGSRTAGIVGRMRDDFTRQQALRSDDAARRERLGQAMDEIRRDIIDPCLALAAPFGFPFDDLNRRAHAFEDQASPRQTDFSLAGNAAVQVVQLEATPPAYLGAFFALAQELAILLLSILRDLNRGARVTARRPAGMASRPMINWGADPSDPPIVAAAKIILGGLADGSSYLPASFGEDEKPEIQANMQQLLRMLRRDGSAKPARFRRGIHLTLAAIETLERTVEDHTAGERAERNGVAPGAAAAVATASPQPDQGARESADTSADLSEHRLGTPNDQDIPDPSREQPVKGGTRKRQIGTRS